MRVSLLSALERGLGAQRACHDINWSLIWWERLLERPMRPTELVDLHHPS
jgi:hypothetical protein